MSSTCMCARPFAMPGAKGRRQGDALPPLVCWVDLDQPPIDPVLYGHLVAAGGLVGRSGSNDHQHLYLPLTAPVDLGTHKRLNRALAARLGGDAKWPDNSLLRMPRRLQLENDRSTRRRRSGGACAGRGRVMERAARRPRPARRNARGGSDGTDIRNERRADRLDHPRACAEPTSRARQVGAQPPGCKRPVWGAPPAGRRLRRRRPDRGSGAHHRGQLPPERGEVRAPAGRGGGALVGTGRCEADGALHGLRADGHDRF